MKTIFDVLDAIEASKYTQGRIFRAHLSDHGRPLIMLCSESPLRATNGWVRFAENQAIAITFRDKEPGVISSRKHKHMQMALSLVMRDTYYPIDMFVKFEEISKEMDVVDVVQTISGLRNSIEQKAKGNNSEGLIL